MERGEGERLHAERRRRFWTLLGVLALIGAISGFIGGFMVGHQDASGIALSPSLLTLAAAGVVLVAILVAYFSWRFFVTVDEVELADNLWGSLIGFYVYAILFPAWYAMYKLGKAPEPDDWLIFGAAMITASVAYGFRKWQSR